MKDFAMDVMSIVFLLLMGSVFGALIAYLTI